MSKLDEMKQLVAATLDAHRYCCTSERLAEVLVEALVDVDAEAAVLPPHPDNEADMNALPVGTVVQDCEGDTWKHQPDGQWGLVKGAPGTRRAMSAKALSNYMPIIVLRVEA